MNGPWERFQSAEPEGPWARFQPTPEPTDVAEDAGRSFAAGVGRGAIGIGGLPADIGMAVQKYVVDPVQKFTTGRTQERLIPEETVRQYGSEALIRDATSGEGTNVPAMPGLAHQPQTTAGKYAKTVGEFAPGAALGVGGLGRRLATQVVAPAVVSEAAGQAAQGTPYEGAARVAGAVAGGLAPAAASRMVTPFQGASPTHRQMVDVLRREGVEPTAGQAVNNRGLKAYESEMGGGSTTRTLERQGEQFTGAALRRVGENANRATPEIIDQAFTRIGQQFDDLAARNTATIDNAFVNDVQRVVGEYNSLVPQSARAPIVDAAVQDITRVVQANGPALGGPAYQAMRSRLDRAARASRNDPQLQEALYGLRTSLDDAMERSISPADQAAWREARNQYRNMIVIERAATGNGPNAAEGIISPSALRNATVNAHGRRNYARGDGDFAELSRAGEAVLKPLPNSGTAERLAARGLPGLVSGAIGATIGAAGGGPIGAGFGATVGAAAGSGINRTMGHAAMTRPVQALLANQLMAGSHLGDDAMRASLAEALRAPSQLSNRR
jgi:hypothetical protein